MEQPTAEDQLEALANAALKEHEGGTMSLWEIEENIEEREYWKKIWKLGFSTAVSKYKEELKQSIIRWEISHIPVNIVLSKMEEIKLSNSSTTKL